MRVRRDGPRGDANDAWGPERRRSSGKGGSPAAAGTTTAGTFPTKFASGRPASQRPSAGEGPLPARERQRGPGGAPLGGRDGVELEPGVEGAKVAPRVHAEL